MCLRPTARSFFTTGQIYACMYETPRSFVRKCAKTMFAGFKGYVLQHACMLIRTRLHNTCVSDSLMKSVLLRWTPSLNDRSKLKGQNTDVKSGCVTSVGPSLNPLQSQFENFSRDTVPLKWTVSRDFYPQCLPHLLLQHVNFNVRALVFCPAIFTR